jgi:hypothetical protein
MLVDDPVLARLYEKWQQEDPIFAQKLEAARRRQGEARRRQYGI